MFPRDQLFQVKTNILSFESWLDPNITLFWGGRTNRGSTVTIICPTKDNSLHGNFFWTRNIWTLGNIFNLTCALIKRPLPLAVGVTGASAVQLADIKIQTWCDLQKSRQKIIFILLSLYSGRHCVETQEIMKPKNCLNGWSWCQNKLVVSCIILHYFGFWGGGEKNFHCAVEAYQAYFVASKMLFLEVFNEWYIP